MPDSTKVEILDPDSLQVVVSRDAVGIPAGGTTGQTLAKSSGTDYDAAWSSAGSGDLLAANNLSDVALASTARTNLGLAIGTDVQAYAAALDAVTGTNTGDEAAASATVSGTVELATIAEVDTGTDTVRAVTPAGLAGSALQTKVDGIETAATADQTGAEIKTAYELEADTNAYDDAAVSKLAGIEALADVTDVTNVTAAGALMDSEVDADIKTLVLPASTTISAFGATVVDDADAAAVRTTIGAAADEPVPTLVTGTTDQLAAADHGVTIRYNNASAVTVTIPTDATDDLPDGFWCSLFSEGAGGVTLSTAGITLTGSTPNTTIAQNEIMVLQKTSTADTWMVLGATAA